MNEEKRWMKKNDFRYTHYWSATNSREQRLMIIAGVLGIILGFMIRGFFG